MSPSSTLHRATLTSTRAQGLVELDALLDGVEGLPPEIRVMIWRAAVPRRLRYQFRGFSDWEFNAMHNKIAALFLSSNQTMYREAMDIWLSENIFDFFVESTEAAELKVVSSLRLYPPERDLEASIRRIAAMANATKRLRVSLNCSGSLWRLFPQFFALFELLYENDMTVSVNGKHPSLQPLAVSGRTYTLNINFPHYSKSGEVLLKLIDSVREAKTSGVPYDQLKKRFDDLLKSEQCLAPINQARVTRKLESLNAIENLSVYPGPLNLLYKTPQAAARARKAVNAGKPAHTGSLPPEWVRDEVMVPLRAWQNELIAHYTFLFSDDLHIPGAVQPNALSKDTIFGFYGNKRWSQRPTNAKQIERHKKLCETELYRTNAHIIAMGPYSA